MKLDFTEEQQLLHDSLERTLSDAHDAFGGRREHLPTFDPQLWEALVELGFAGLRVQEHAGGSGLGLFEAAIAMELVGRYVSPVPLLDALVAGSCLSQFPSPLAAEAIERLTSGQVIGFAPTPTDNRNYVLPAGEVARTALVYTGEEFLLVERPKEVQPLSNLARAPLAIWHEPRIIACLAKGDEAREAHEAALVEWRLMVASYLTGAGTRAVELAAEYAQQRKQFGNAIGSYQGLAHPLADAITAVEGGRLLVWSAIAEIARRGPRASADSALAFGWMAKAAPRAAERAIHTFGGHGLALSSDIHLYFARAKGWAQLAGDPTRAFIEAADRLWRGARTGLPVSEGDSPDFELPAETEEYRLSIREFFETNLTDELQTRHDLSWEGVDFDFQKILAANNLLFPNWPREYGGEGRSSYDLIVLREEFLRAGCSHMGIGVTRLVAETLFAYGSDELKAEVLPKVTRGEALFCLGYTEPEAGSDVAAAELRSERVGNEWILNGQKIFNSGAGVAQYVFLLTRSDPDLPKHGGLTMFLVPLDTPGIEVFPFDTVSSEITNSTYFTDVRIPDHFRVGAENGGWAVMRYALGLEHAMSFWQFHEKLLDRVIAWATDGPSPRIVDDEFVRARLGLVAARGRISLLLFRRAVWAQAEGKAEGFEGPMSKLFSSEAFLEDASDLVDMAAPHSVFNDGRIDRGCVQFGIESAYRHAIAATNYGGTSEMMRSHIAQLRLGLPRGR